MQTSSSSVARRCLSMLSSSSSSSSNSSSTTPLLGPPTTSPRDDTAHESSSITMPPAQPALPLQSSPAFVPSSSSLSQQQRFQPSTAEPISAAEFAAAAQQAGITPKSHIAIAVSGGPDSMALVALLHRYMMTSRLGSSQATSASQPSNETVAAAAAAAAMPNTPTARGGKQRRDEAKSAIRSGLANSTQDHTSNKKPPRNLLAFTVDHGFRPESADEVVFVKKLLERRFGIQTYPLKITWPDGLPSGPSKLGDARDQRYQMMADELVKMRQTLETAAQTASPTFAAPAAHLPYASHYTAADVALFSQRRRRTAQLLAQLCETAGGGGGKLRTADLANIEIPTIRTGPFVRDRPPRLDDAWMSHYLHSFIIDQALSKVDADIPPNAPAKSMFSPVLAVAHHADDRLESMIMRFSRASQMDGLRGPMAWYNRLSPDNSSFFSIVRPLLPFPKARLVATCEAMGVPYVRDPSNDDLAFRRNSVRFALRALPGEVAAAIATSETRSTIPACSQQPAAPQKQGRSNKVASTSATSSAKSATATTQPSLDLIAGLTRLQHKIVTTSELVEREGWCLLGWELFSPAVPADVALRAVKRTLGYYSNDTVLRATAAGLTRLLQDIRSFDRAQFGERDNKGKANNSSGSRGWFHPSFLAPITCTLPNADLLERVFGSRRRDQFVPIRSANHCSINAVPEGVLFVNLAQNSRSLFAPPQLSSPSSDGFVTASYAVRFEHMMDLTMTLRLPEAVAHSLRTTPSTAELQVRGGTRANTLLSSITKPPGHPFRGVPFVRRYLASEDGMYLPWNLKFTGQAHRFRNALQPHLLTIEALRGVPVIADLDGPIAIPHFGVVLCEQIVDCSVRNVVWWRSRRTSPGLAELLPTGSSL
ncbi:hypothetical protein CAOG_004539 [Capsaspora owczarzaki ATCC 30864]|uniref:tRNA(Ile)-lysidine synthetase n=1 Tax=Capsaspora owczarzaki (strain ATCC 30864) TaxID=595528 RepID=A0A0D2UFA6_CAPO3|nr:hypothetical protein CAOG_004539 [Capsaspora owczarzaki ATCC 30864]